MSRPLQDAAARRAAQEIFDRPLILEAGAGTGKTATLVNRVLTWSLGPGWEQARASLEDRWPRELTRREIAAEVQKGIVAITFTEAAATELEDRIGSALLEVARGGSPLGLIEISVDPERAGELHAELSRLRVSTIHSFCQRILADHPLEASLPPQLTVDARGDLLAEAVHDLLEEALPEEYGREGSELVELAARGIGPAEIEAALVDLAREDVSETIFEADPWPETATQTLLDEMEAAVSDWRQAGGGELRTLRRAQVSMHTAETIERTEERLAQTGSATERLASIRELWTDGARGRLKKWSQGAWSPTEMRALEAGSPEAAEAAASFFGPLEVAFDGDPELLNLARRTIHRLLAELRARLRARGIVSFSALLVQAVRLLETQPSILDRRRREIRQLLVDEFQDTDDRQIELVRRLALSGPPEQRPGLALVGDPKQSIYGWRNADLAAYHQFVQEVLQAGGELYRLSVNFRSCPPVLDEVQRSVQPLMRHEPGVQPPYEDLDPAPDRLDDPDFVAEDHGPVELWVPWDPETAAPPSAGVGTELEARSLADDLCRLREAGAIDWPDVGILFRATTDLDLYLGALRRAGVPYEVERDRGYYRRREIIEAAALARAVLDPCDHLALLTVLRSSWVGVPDAALIPLWSRSLPELLTRLHGPDETLLAELDARIDDAAAALPAELAGLEELPRWPRALQGALATLGTLRESARTDPADRLVGRLRRLTCFEAGEAARHLGSYRAANLDRFFRELRERLDDPDQDVPSILRHLRTAVARRREEQEARPPEPVADAVRVLSIHSAMGLGFSHVYVLQMGKEPPPKEDDQGTEVDRDGEYRLFGTSSPGFHRVQSRRQRVAEAERVRTLYVALTRARIRLVLSGRWIVPSVRGRSHLSLLAPHRAPADLATRFDPDRPFFRDEHGVLWRFLTATAHPSDPPTLPHPETETISADRLHREARMLDRAREAAHHYQALPFLRSVTDDQAPAHCFRSSGVDRETARLAGRWVHTVLEEIALDGDPTEQIRARTEELLAGAATPVQRSAADRARGLLERFVAGPLLPRWIGLRDHIAGREIPVLLGPDGEAVGATVGRIDLVYLDPRDGSPVVVDFKTDDLEGKAEASSQAALHRPQLELYARALAEALELPDPPRTELWFLSIDHVVAVDSPPPP